MKLAEIGEFALIAAIREMAAEGEGVIKGIGDDAAVLRPTPGMVSLVTTDLLLEGVHFQLDLTDPYRLGRKAVAINLSDIASCGGQPRAMLVSLAIAPDAVLAFVQSLYKGMLEQAQEFKVALVGGDTSRAEKLLISVTMIGEAEEAKIVYRAGAKKGDLIFVTGQLGDAALGLRQLKQGGKEGGLVQRHLTPVPRVKQGQAIAQRGLATAMIDISDGLVADLGHIAEASAVGAEIRLSALPLSEEYRKEVRAYTPDLYQLALTGGEDYELLFTSAPEKEQAVGKLAQELGIPIQAIGEIVDLSAGIRVIGAGGKEYLLKHKGHDHFR
ncbi:MAG: thiamine-phosphate kinase [Desulfobacterales bacterium]|nr:thiamine-phosphate kinase [Desulfobacterales bacterium]